MAQGTRIVLTINGSTSELDQLGATRAELSRFSKGSYSKIDSAFVSHGLALFNVSEEAPVFYRLSIGTAPEIVIIVAPSEQDVHISGSYYDLQIGNLSYGSSFENECMMLVRKAETLLARTYFQVIPRYRAGVAKNEAQLLDAQLYKAQIAFNSEMAAIANVYSNSFCADLVVSNLFSPLKMDSTQSIDAFFQHHALDSLHVQDERLLSLPNFFAMLNAYRKNFIPKDVKGEQLFVDELFGRPEMHPELRRHLFNIHLQFYASRNWAEMIAYIMQANTSVAIDTATTDGQLATSIQNLFPGKKAFDMALADTSNTMIRLSDLVEGKQRGFIVFYNHECDHCLELLPQLSEALCTSDSTIVVYAVDTHHDQEEWRQFVAKHHYPFTHVFLPNDIGPEVALHYAMLSIPTVVIVDGTMNIIDRFASVDRIIEMLGCP